MFPACLLDNRDADLFVFFHLFGVKMIFDEQKSFFSLKKGVQTMLPERRAECHFQKILGSEASRERLLYIYKFLYILRLY
jgi:hypothetical protein